MSHYSHQREYDDRKREEADRAILAENVPDIVSSLRSATSGISQLSGLLPDSDRMIYDIHSIILKLEESIK
jgi:hypothetical protein